MNFSTKIALKDSEFRKLSRFISERYGIVLPYSKKTMLEGRLQKRLCQHQFRSFNQYYELITSSKGKKEIIHMVDRVSTNKTDFFREPAHFDFLEQVILPEYEKKCGMDHQKLRVWSSASSSGEEAYTACMVIEEYNRNKGYVNYSILGTDISYEILKKAVDAVYPENSTHQIPKNLKERYFLRSKDRKLNLVRVIPEIRNKTTFSRLNLMQASYGETGKFDLIFCRNVLIYFDRSTQEEVVRKQCQTLRKGGYFFLGHTESISGMELPLRQIYPTIYQKI